MQPIQYPQTATRTRPRAATRRPDCIKIWPRFACALPLTFAISACDAMAPVDGVLTCTAERECFGETCTPSDVTFNLSTDEASDLRIDFSNGSYQLNFVETTLATSSQGGIQLTTFENLAEPLRLTLAQNESNIRARLIVQSSTGPRNISATCVEREGA